MADDQDHVTGNQELMPTDQDPEKEDQVAEALELALEGLSKCQI